MTLQSYKDWIARWLGQNNQFGGELARIIHSDPQFPTGSDRSAIHRRLKELGASESAMTAFIGAWKLYEKDASKRSSESSLESKLVHEVEKRGGLCWKFTSPGTVGVPDRVVMVPGGKVAFVEMKAPGGKLRPIQRKRADEILDRDVPWYCLKSNQDILVFLQEMFGDGV